MILHKLISNAARNIFKTHNSCCSTSNLCRPWCENQRDITSSGVTALVKRLGGSTLSLGTVGL